MVNGWIQSLTVCSGDSKERGRSPFMLRPLVRNGRTGAKPTEALGRAWGLAIRHQRAVSTMTSFRAEWVLIG